eukprot:jgi/Tetstr1/458551/TSEL_044954.t1
MSSSAGSALGAVVSRINKSVEAHNVTRQPRLVAVSKTKPVELLQEVYDAGHRVFGENYVQELVDKAPLMPADVQWHFVGHLQSNKAKLLLESVPNLSMLETVDSAKLANRLNNVVEGMGRPPLNVMVQVNTSGEESKYGVEPEDVVELAKHVQENCPHLKFVGLMTIGMKDYTSRPENFECLQKCRSAVCEALSLQEDEVELSMGMSGDFENAIAMGSTNVRVGSTIFGARDYSKN